MLNLAEYRRKPQTLADFLPWAALVAPGVVLNKVPTSRGHYYYYQEYYNNGHEKQNHRERRYT